MRSMIDQVGKIMAKGGQKWLIRVVIVYCIKEPRKSVLQDINTLPLPALAVVSKDLQVFSMAKNVVVAGSIKELRKSVLQGINILSLPVLAVAMRQIQADDKVRRRR
jgi:hypothetical protein